MRTKLHTLGLLGVDACLSLWCVMKGGDFEASSGPTVPRAVSEAGEGQPTAAQVGNVERVLRSPVDMPALKLSIFLQHTGTHI